MFDDSLHIHSFSKHTLYSLHSLLAIIILMVLASCKDHTEEAAPAEENAEAKTMMQGVWIDEDSRDLFFMAKGDTIYYAEGDGEPVAFFVRNDSLFLKSSRPEGYPIRTLTERTLRFVNSEGYDVNLEKSIDKSLVARFVNTAIKERSLNQGRLIKRDSVMTKGDRRYHAYVQVNPTRYKVLRQTTNDDGMLVDVAYYDNIIHIALYDGARSIYSKDFRKGDFARYVPQSYLERSILSDIEMDRATVKGVVFVAILTEPETYTSYHVNILICHDGKVEMSV